MSADASPEAGRAQILARLDQTKSDMDRYYHAFLQLENVVSQLASNQAELIRSVEALRQRRGREPPGEPAAAPRWRGVVCAHGQRRYRCRHAACVAAAERGREGRAARRAPRT